MIKKFNLIVCLCFFSSLAYAIEDDLLKSIEISTHGSKFQAERIKIAAENLANEDSTSTTPGGNPYKRKVIYPKNIYDKRLKTYVLITSKVDFDKAPFNLKYDPNHPAADKDGLVKYPSVRKEIERADATEAQISYDANLAIMEMSNRMIDKTLDAMR